jgi:hypothetical protein
MTARARVSPLGLLLLAAVVAAAAWLGLRLGHGGGDDADYTTRGPVSAARARAWRRSACARSAATSSRSAGAGHPTVVMVSSETCTYCDQALRDLGRLAGGRPLPAPARRDDRGRRARPADGRGGGRARRRARRPGDAGGGGAVRLPDPRDAHVARARRAGRVTRTMLGYPGEAVLPAWLGVMTGARDAP